MKEEDKKITVFNKNGISIIKYIDRSTPSAKFPYVVYNTFDTPSRIYTNYGFAKSKKSKTVKVKKESPLGFYYYKDVVIEDATKVELLQNDLSKSIVDITIRNLDDTYTYKITYLMCYHGVTVDKETRPWDLIGGSFPDNYIFGLLDDINEIFTELESIKGSKAYKKPSVAYFSDYMYDLEHSSPMRVGEMKRMIIKDLFGNPNGPRFQTNTEKILAHGFDTKTSFRKM